MLRDNCDDTFSGGHGNIVQVVQHPVNFFLLYDKILAVDTGQDVLVFNTFDMAACHTHIYSVHRDTAGSAFGQFLGNVNAVNGFVDVVNQTMLHACGFAFAMTDNIDFIISFVSDDCRDFRGSYVKSDHYVRHVCLFFFFHG